MRCTLPCHPGREPAASAVVPRGSQTGQGERGTPRECSGSLGSSKGQLLFLGWGRRGWRRSLVHQQSSLLMLGLEEGSSLFSKKSQE